MHDGKTALKKKMSFSIISDKKTHTQKKKKTSLYS